MDKLSLFRREDHDKSKIIISCKNAIISGFKLKRLLLEEHKIECEMAMPDYLLALSTLCDTNLGFDKLTYALCEIDKRINRKDEPITAPIPPSPTVKMSIREATESASELLPIGFSVGRVSADFVYAYPPGSPIIAPGEIITASALSSAKALAAMGANVYSSSGDLEKINCVK